MSEAEAHGVALICERHDGHTVAWVDHHMSKQVPAGYFTETLVLNKRLHSYKSESRAGTLDGGYATMPFCVGLREPTVEQVTWHDWYDAVLWCRDDARQAEKILAMRVPLTAAFWQMTREGNDDGE